MTPLAWLIGLFLPACGQPGAAGLPVPPVMDMASIQRPASPNTALAAPPGSLPVPDVETGVYALSASKLYASILAVASAQPRTFPAAAYPDQLQVHFVARSALFNFPDLIAIQAQPVGPDASTLAIWSRSVYGHSDLGANRKRVLALLASLSAQAPLKAP